MILGRTTDGKIQIKQDPLRAVNCACCGCPAEIQITFNDAEFCGNDFCESYPYGNQSYVLVKYSENDFTCGYSIDPESSDVLTAIYQKSSEAWSVYHFVDSVSGIVGLFYGGNGGQPIVCTSNYPSCDSEEFGFGPCMYGGTATIIWPPTV